MKAVKPRRKPFLGTLVSLLIIAGAIVFGVHTIRQVWRYPSTDDARIDADVVHIAALVGGRIVTIAVTENGHVAKGDLLFQIDPVPYRLSVDQAEADLALAEATLDSKRRLVSTQQSAATIASEQTKRAVTNYDLATRTVARLKPLAVKGYIPVQQLDQAESTQRDAATSLQQARVQEVAALNAIDTIAAEQAAVQARKAALAIARRSLDDTTVRAPTDGRVSGLTVLAGEIVAPSQSLFTLINTDEWFADANFQETQLNAIRIDDCVTVYSLIERSKPIKGVVDGIGWGVADEDKINLPRSVPYVEPSLNWVRVAQRFPVRIRLENPPEPLMRIGASAAVEVKHGAACHR
jgi:multidrug efflux system membrane fusion protein